MHACIQMFSRRLGTVVEAGTIARRTHQVGARTDNKHPPRGMKSKVDILLAKTGVRCKTG